jgi:hypothetical protein
VTTARTEVPSCPTGRVTTQRASEDGLCERLPPPLRLSQACLTARAASHERNLLSPDMYEPTSQAVFCITEADVRCSFVMPRPQHHSSKKLANGDLRKIGRLPRCMRQLDRPELSGPVVRIGKRHSQGLYSKAREGVCRENLIRQRNL